MYDKATGGCRDGLHVDRLNENQGAESTLSLIQSMLEMKQFARAHQDQLRSNREKRPSLVLINSPKMRHGFRAECFAVEAY